MIASKKLSVWTDLSADQQAVYIDGQFMEVHDQFVTTDDLIHAVGPDCPVVLSSFGVRLDGSNWPDEEHELEPIGDAATELRAAAERADQYLEECGHNMDEDVVEAIRLLIGAAQR